MFIKLIMGLVIVNYISNTNAGYQAFDQSGRSYKFHKDALTWTEARSACEMEGGNLVVSGSHAETRTLIEICQQNKAYCAGMMPVGLYWEAGVWMTVDGPTLEEVGGHAVWGKGQPNDMDRLPYVYMRKDGSLANGSNKFKYPYICENASI